MQQSQFRDYLNKHRSRIPEYERYQLLGIPIGSGDVEFSIKQVRARVKLAEENQHPDCF